MTFLWSFRMEFKILLFIKKNVVRNIAREHPKGKKEFSNSPNTSMTHNRKNSKKKGKDKLRKTKCTKLLIK